MADYSNFPFSNFTVAEVFALARESKDIGDKEFVTACMESIRLNKCKADEHNADVEIKTNEDRQWDMNAFGSSLK